MFDQSFFSLFHFLFGLLRIDVHLFPQLCVLIFDEPYVRLIVRSFLLDLFSQPDDFQSLFRAIVLEVSYFLVEQFHLLLEGVIGDLESFGLAMFELNLEAISAPLMLFLQILQVFPQYLYLVPHLGLFVLGVAQSRPQLCLQL